jgi:hypothetical protein
LKPHNSPPSARTHPVLNLGDQRVLSQKVHQALFELVRHGGYDEREEGQFGGQDEETDWIVVERKKKVGGGGLGLDGVFIDLRGREGGAYWNSKAERGERVSITAVFWGV